MTTQHNSSDTPARASDLLRAALLMERSPVAVTVFEDAASLGAFPAPHPEEPLSYCAAVLAATQGHALVLTARDMSCDTSPRILGVEADFFERSFIDSYAEGGLYRDHDTAHSMLAEVDVLSGTYGIAVAPLELQPTDVAPDVVVVMTNPHGAMRLAQSAAFMGHRAGQQLLGMHGMCAETTVAPLVSGEMRVSLLCSGARHAGGWSDDVLSVGVPAAMLDDVVAGLRLTADRFEPDEHKAQMGVRGCSELADLHEGGAYYLGPDSSTS